ncbi:DoxX family protein [Lysinibacillus endophyticus]|uniref:DoxX family protein n=1 Tax=Ureibacillus endophyticus TaxID=1978490 RepID=A0A494Z0M3_9BACL|nr:DoxX family protein [Lysinibacillus endophyticus]
MLAKYEIGALIIRVVLGVIFFVHGLTKFQEGINETVTRFAEYGIPYAQYVAYGVGGIELLGGFFLIIGFSVRFVSALLIAVMVGAIMKVKLEAGFLNGYEFNVALIAMASYLLVAGSRLLALDKLFTSEPKKKARIEFKRSY